MAKIKTFEGACKALKLKSDCLPDVSKMPSHHQAATLAHAKLVIIAEALNEGWKPDWTNSSEYKYYPWFDMTSGSSAVYDYYYFWCSDSYVGSRLCFKNASLAEYAGKQFRDLYNDLFILN